MGTTRRADLIVVGAGPAGSAAGIAAADAGLDVVVVDKATFPRDKTCGDGLTAGALRLLEALGVAVPGLSGYQPVTDAVLVSPSGRVVPLPLPGGGQYAGVVARRDLDAAMVAVARAHGAVVLEGHAVTAVSRDGTVTLESGDTLAAPWVVAADGHYSTVRRRLDPAEPADLGTWHAFRQYVTGVDDPRLWVLFEPDLLPGYAWVFPLPDGRANVGFGVRRRHARDGHRLAETMRTLLERPRVGAVLGPRVRTVGPHRAWPIPAGFDPRRLTSGPVLFAGDAAGVVDPMTGEGIAQAVETGLLAVAAISAGGDVAGRYRRTVTRALLADLRFADALSSLLRTELGARVALRCADLSAWTRRNFARWMFEDYPRAILATPRRWHRGMLTGPGAYPP